MVPTRTNFHSIQLLRAVAALLVVLFHADGAYSRAGAKAIIIGESYIFGFGAVGVHIFFVISGFIMVVASRFEPAFDRRDFLRRRVLRIYPIYWACVGLYVSVHWALSDPYNISLRAFVGAIALWPGNSSAVIGPAWTLSYEIFFYLCFAAVMGFGLTRGLWLLVVMFVCLVGAGFLFQPSYPALHVITDSLLLEFVAGAAIGYLLKAGHLPLRAGVLSFASSIVLFIAGGAYGYHRLLTIISWGIPSALLVAGVACLEVRRGANSIVRAVGRFGDSSYVLYLIHILIITVSLPLALSSSAFMKAGAVVAAALVSVACVVIAEVIHHRVERPFLQLVKSPGILALSGGRRGRPTEQELNTGPN